MRIFFDFEFIEGGAAFVMEPISIGIVREDGEEYYAEFTDVDWGKANEWVLTHVKPFLDPQKYSLSKPTIVSEIHKFVGEKPEFWAYFADYDWVLMCQLFGNMTDLPSDWPKYCLDIKQFMWHLGYERSDIPIDNQNHHLAIADARWNLQVFTYLKSKMNGTERAHQSA